MGRYQSPVDAFATAARRTSMQVAVDSTLQDYRPIDSTDQNDRRDAHLPMSATTILQQALRCVVRTTPQLKHTFTGLIANRCLRLDRTQPQLRCSTASTTDQDALEQRHRTGLGQLHRRDTPPVPTVLCTLVE